MELIRKIASLLSRVRDRRVAAKYCDTDVWAPCQVCAEEFPQQAWRSFLCYLDKTQQNPDCKSRDCLHKLACLHNASEKKYLDFFYALAENKEEWRSILNFADIPAQFDNELFDDIASEFSRARNISEQTKMIPGLFASADPTRLELLSLLLEGNIERYPQPSTTIVSELVEREKAARTQLSLLLTENWTDEIRWWLVRALACSTAAARNFLKNQIPEKHDERLTCMTLPILLKTGFALIRNQQNQNDPKAGQRQKLFSGQLTRLTAIIGNSATLSQSCDNKLS